MSTTLQHADRTLLPRGLIARRTFQIGQQVTFHGITGTIVEASTSLRGQHLYTVVFQDDADRGTRTVRGQYLEPAPAPVAASGYLAIFEPGTIVRLKNRQTYTAGKLRPDLPGVDLLADGQPMLTASAEWLKRNVASLGLPQAA